MFVTLLSLIQYDTICYFNVRSKADVSQLNLPHLNTLCRPVDDHVIFYYTNWLNFILVQQICEKIVGLVVKAPKLAQIMLNIHELI